MAFKLAPTLKRNPLPLAVCAAAALLTWLAVGVLRIPMAYVVLGLGGAMFALAWWWLGRTGRA
jgi:chromate transporter